MPENSLVPFRKSPLAQVPTSVSNHHQLLSIEFDRLLTYSELAPSPTHSSHPPLDATSPLLLLEILCEDLVATEINQSLHKKYQRAQTLLQFWNETPVIGTLWNTIIGTLIGTYIEGDLNMSLNELQRPNHNQYEQPKNHFDLEPLKELSFAPQLRMPTNPYIREHEDIQLEDISLGHATLNLHQTLSAIKDLFPPLHHLPGPLARPTKSALFQIETPVQLTAEQAIERSYQDQIDHLREPPRTHLIPTPRTRVFADYILQTCHTAAAEDTGYPKTPTQARVVAKRKKETSTHPNPQTTKKARRKQQKN
jgi:hypothetical protein